jgi:hypothetical protein
VDLFTQQEEAERAARQEAILRHSWDTWGWDGPSVGGMCEVGMPIVRTPDGGGLYCYMELARLIEQQEDGRWLAEIAMPEPWHKNGRRILMDRHDIAPPRRLIHAARQQQQKEQEVE